MRAPRLCRFAIVAVVLTACLPGQLAADPFCCGGGPSGLTLAGDYQQASLVLLGRFINAKPGAGFQGGTTDFVVETAFKKNPLLAGKERLTLPKYLPATGKKKFLIFCDVSRGVIDSYRAVEVLPGSELAKYFRGAIAVKDRPLSERLRYAFDYLNSADTEVALDAFREYAQSSYKDYRALAKTLPAAKLAGWLNDPKTPPHRYGLYALLLGECGTARDAQTLRRLLDDPKKLQGGLSYGGAEGPLAGYLILQPQEGWAYLRNVLEDGKQSFRRRYSALRTVRFLWDQRPDLFPKAKLVEAVASNLDHPDMADLALEDLRKWGRWELCDRVLALSGKEAYDTPIVRRAILRYALCCPGPRAAAFIRAQRRLAPDLIADLEECLKPEPAGKAP